MVNFALIVILAGVMILLGIAIWTNQRRNLGVTPEIEEDFSHDVAALHQDRAVFVAKSHGRLVHVNQTARDWLGIRDGLPSLEQAARLTVPEDNFKQLFINEGNTSFRFGNRWVEGISHRIPDLDGARFVVSLRELQAEQTHSSALDVSASMRIIHDLGKTINASLSVEQAVQTILSILGMNMDIDAGEICLWNADEQALYPKGWTGDLRYMLQLDAVGGRYLLGDGITGWVAKYRQPILVSDPNTEDSVAPKIDDNGYNSYIAVPLILNDNFIGTLEVLHKMRGKFTFADLALVESISSTVAMAVHNATLYAEQSRRIDNMASLQQITQDSDIANDTSAVYYALNQRVANLLDAEVCGILLLDQRRGVLVGQPPFFGLPDQLANVMSIRVDENAAAYHIWTQQNIWMANDLSDEPLLDDMGISPVVSAAGLRNLVLVVMYIGNQSIGMMFVANKRTLGGFSSPDIQNLRILVAQAAIVVENVRLFERERRQDTELAGLQEITHAIGALSHEDEDEVYSDINMRIAGLMGIQMCGIMVYDESAHRLIAQPPFYGVDDAAIANYEIDLDGNEVLRELWEDADFWYSNHAQTDTLTFATNLAEMAESIGVEKTLFATLSSSGQKVGIIQVSNKFSGDDFTDSDARLLLIFATQAAAIIENSRLVRQIQRSAQEANRLRHLAESAGNVVALDETLHPVLSDIADMLDSQVVFLTVVSEQADGLITHPRAVFGADLDYPVRVAHDSPHYKQLVTHTKSPLITNHAVLDQYDMPAYTHWVEQLDIKRMAIVPLVIGDLSLGELGVANREQSLYTDSDIELLKTIATQLASTLDRVRLFEAAGQNLERRVKELDAISYVSTVLNDTIDLNTILEAIRTQSALATEAEGGTVAVLRQPDVAQSGEQIGLVYRVGESENMLRLAPVEQDSLNSEQLVTVISDYQSAKIAALPRQARSAVALVFQYANEPVGIIHLFDARPDWFNDRTVVFLKTMASKASLGYGNALRFHEQMERSRTLRQRVEQLNQIFELGQIVQSNSDPAEMLEAMAFSIVQSGGFDVVVITMVDTQTQLLRRVAQAGLPVDAFERSQSDVLAVSQIDDLLHEELRISESYFYPIEKIIEWEIAGLDALSAAFIGNRTMHAQGANAWNDGDMLLVPINGADKQLLGIMSLDRPQDNLRPSRAKIEVLEIFAHQAASTIENNRLYLNSVRSAETEARLNEMMENIASTLEIDAIIESVAHNALRLAPFQHMSVALRSADETEPGYDVIRIHVQPDDTLTLQKTSQQALEGTALGECISQRNDLVFTSYDDISRYQDLAEWHREGEQIAFIVPLISGGVALGAIHFGSNRLHEFDVDELRGLFNRLAQLVAVTIQNARLFSQAVNLQIFNESVVESIQQGIVVMDVNARVISANEYMESFYGWEVGSKKLLFDYMPEVKEALSGKLNEVFVNGDPIEVTNLRTETDNHDYSVRNFYIYPLRAGATINGAVLMIEDITEKARLEANIEARANQLAALNRASSEITSTLERSRVIETALDMVQDIVEYDAVALWRRDGEHSLQLMGVRGVDVALSPPIRMVINENERLKYIVEMRSVLTLDDLPRFLETYPQHLPADLSALSWLGVPLLYQDAVIGLIALAKNERAFYTPQSEQVALAFANQVAVALTNAELFTETSARTERLSTLNRVSLSLVQSMDSENIFEIALNQMANILRSEQSRAILFDNELTSGRVIVDAPRGDFTPTQQIDILTSETFRYVLERKHPLVYSHDRTNMPESLSDTITTEIESRALKDYLLVPMVAPGVIIGAFEFETRSQSMALNPENLETNLIIANQTAIAIQNANQLEENSNRNRELSMLLEAAQTTSLVSDLDQVFRTVADLFITALDMDDCAIMIWNDMGHNLEVQLDVNRSGNPDRISPKGTKLDLGQYPMREKALRSRDVIIIYTSDTDADPKELQELQEQGDSLRMLVPLIVRDQSIGLIQVELSNDVRIITEQERRLARALGAQVAIAIENARLSTESAVQMEELFAINEVSQAISSKIDRDSLLQIVRERVPRVTGARQIYMALYDSETKMITFPLAVRDGEEYIIAPRELGTDEVSFVIRQRRALLLGSDFYAVDEVRRSLGIVAGEGDVKSYLGVPLVSGDEVLGVLAVRDDERTRLFDVNDQRILTTIGAQIGATLQNARLLSRARSSADELNEAVQARTLELQEERDRLDMLYQITAELALTLDMDHVLNRALQMMASAVRAHDGVIMLIDPINDQFYNRASLSHSSSNDERISHPAEAIASWLVNNEHELLVDDLHKEDFWDKSAPGAEAWHSAMAVLLETNEDVQGVLVLLSRDANAFSEPLLNLVIAAANQVASAINNADLYQLIRDQAERLGTLLRTEQEEAEKSKAILESIADGVMVIDSQEQITLLNSTAEEMINLPRDLVLERTLDELVEQYGQDVTVWTKPIIQWTSEYRDSEGSRFFAPDRIEIGERVVSMNIAPVFANGIYLGAVSVFRDVTRDVEVDNMKNQFILNVSHELRTPITPIKGFADMMLVTGGDELSESQVSNISVIKSNADRLARLVEDLLTISKIDAGESPLTVEPVNLAEVINVQLTTARNRHYDKNHTITSEIAEGLPPAILDRGKMMQIISNVIDNAFNYTPAGGKIHVALELDSQKTAHLLFTVRDNGLGIPDAFREKIWDRFSRHDEHALETETSGTGLGLPIVRQLVEMHHGKIWFEAAEGGGTTFFIRLPIDYRREVDTDEVVSSSTSNGA